MGGRGGGQERLVGVQITDWRNSVFPFKNNSHLSRSLPPSLLVDPMCGSRGVVRTTPLENRKLYGFL